MGDYSTNLALVLASQLGMRPRELAEILVEYMGPEATGCERVEIAGPGFLNFHLGPTWLQAAVAACLEAGTCYGHGTEGRGTRVHLEFVSANPVGPIHIGNARGGPYGDVLGNMLGALGYHVHKEYYVNDGPHNTQAILFGKSLQARYREILGADYTFPENGYAGAYVGDYARTLVERCGDQYLSVAGDDAGAYGFFLLAEEGILAEARRAMSLFGVEYQEWFREAELCDTGAVDREVERLLEIGAAYEHDGAIWLRTGEHGDDQDRVLVRSDGRPTYIASDAAYALRKYQNYDLAIYILGPDHAGYVPRLKAAIEAGGIDPGKVEVIVHQTVRLLRDGEPVRLSKRRGEIIGLDEVVEEVGKDAARFFFLMRSVDSHLDFDLDLAAKQSDENPVYYVQYAHARICSIARLAEERGFAFADSPDFSLLTTPAELALMRVIAEYPHELRAATAARAPHRITTMSRDLAAAFHQFYGVCKVLDESDPELSTARMALVRATQQLLSAQLAMMGLSAPERM
jgi:arginyl-tRNA synthetase